MQRPASVVVFGVLNLVFGALGGVGMLGSAAILLGMSPANPMNKVLEASAFYRAFLWSSMVLGVFAISALIAAGVGLLMSKPWARKLSIAYAIYAIVMGVVGQVVNVVFVVSPLLEASSRGGGPAAIGATGGAIGGMLGGCFGLIFPIALLIFSFQKGIVDYFNAQKAGAPAA